MNNLLTKLGVAGTSSVVVSEATPNTNPLLNALITLGVSILSVLAVEGIAWLKAFIKKHTHKEKDTDEEDKEVK